MTRPRDWAPLAHADPTPGDPYEVERLARHYADTASEIERQVARLRTLSGQAKSGWDSEAGTTFAEHAEETAGKLDQVRTRYAAAAEALRGWVKPLDDTQTRTANALTAAQDAQADLATNTALVLPPEPTPDQLADNRARLARYEDAEGRLVTARKQFDAAVADYHHEDGRLAHDLNVATRHDGLHDSFWDKAVAGLKTACKIIGWVATALAVTALVISLFVPGLNVAVWGTVTMVGLLEGTAAFGAGALLVMHGTLAATGNGSWIAVGADIVALATFAIGTGAFNSLRAANAAAETIAADAAAARATQQVVSSNAREYRIYSMLEQHWPAVGRFTHAGEHLAAMDAEAMAAGSQARAGIEQIGGMTTVRSSLRFGGREEAEYVDHIGRLAQHLPGDGQLADLAKEAQRLADWRMASEYAGGLVDSANHVVEEVKWLETRLAPHFTAPLTHMPAAGGEE